MYKLTPSGINGRGSRFANKVTLLLFRTPSFIGLMVAELFCLKKHFSFFRFPCQVLKKMTYRRDGILWWGSTGGRNTNFLQLHNNRCAVESRSLAKKNAAGGFDFGDGCYYLFEGFMIQIINHYRYIFLCLLVDHMLVVIYFKSRAAFPYWWEIFKSFLLVDVFNGSNKIYLKW